MPRDKHAELLELARLRQAAQWEGYSNLAAYQDGAYECPFVSPYTKSACNVDAKIMVILQDWSSDAYLRRGVDVNLRDLGYSPHYPTNRRLQDLLRETCGYELKDTYATNLFPFIKQGAASAKIRRADLARAAAEFALPQIRIVRPKLVICLGLVTFNALREASALPRFQRLDAAISNPWQLNDTAIWCQAHTGTLGQRNRGAERAAHDWLTMKLTVLNRL